MWCIQQNPFFPLCLFYLQVAICSVAASHSSSDTVWFNKITKNGYATKNNYYNHLVGLGQCYLEGYYLELDSKNTKYNKNSVMKKQVLSGVYSCANYKERQNRILIDTTDITDIILYLKKNGLSTKWFLVDISNHVAAVEI